MDLLPFGSVHYKLKPWLLIMPLAYVLPSPGLIKWYIEPLSSIENSAEEKKNKQESRRRRRRRKRIWRNV